ncbi:HNH endonuclease [Paraliobacillus ryukyuensis]|uniref:HNH endonuclease n=1 Tax=Paraliobacillus ryukyuensis TaxID=200904 RepID=UPI0009A62844|nr:HNH endonuclease [Paraliobacillus ryukyuensis]
MVKVKLKHLKPNEDGVVVVKSSTKNKHRFISFLSYEKALIHVREGSCRVIDDHTVEKFRSNKQMKKYIKKRDNYTCHYCGGYGDTIDHKTPKSKGGCSTPFNLVCSCAKCNEDKGDMDYEEFMKTKCLVVV